MAIIEDYAAIAGELRGPGLSQISDVDGSSGVAVNFIASGSEAAHDPECDC
jgi:hypothetical protein